MARLPRIRPYTLVIASALYFTALLNLPFWSSVGQWVPASSAGDIRLLGTLAVIVFLVNLVLISLVSFPYVLKSVLVVLLLASAAGSYFMSEYGVLVDANMLRNVFETDSAEAFGLLSTSLLLHVAVLGVLPALVLSRIPVQWGSMPRSLVRAVGISALSLALALGAVLSFAQATMPFFRVHGKEVRWKVAPLNLVLSAAYLARDAHAAGVQKTFTRIASHARIVPPPASQDRPPLFVLVVGETARAANFSLNGYSRDTNAALAAMDVVSFSDVHSCGTATAASLPCMFSDLTRADYSRSGASQRENLLDLAQRAGYRVIWLDNQSGSKGVADRVEYRQIESPAGGGGEANDLAMLPAVQQVLEQLDKPTLLVLHQMGSHGPEYFKRTVASAKRFVPECEDKQLEKCAAQGVINAYDNTIVNTSLLLAGLIDTARREPGVPFGMLYISDHGESLGESGLYLHGMPYSLAPDVQTRVPMIYWSNDAFDQYSELDRTCIKERRTDALSHDNLFDLVLGVLRIDTDVSRAALDPFHVCRAPVAKVAAPLAYDASNGTSR